MIKKSLSHFIDEVKLCDPADPFSSPLSLFQDERIEVYYAPFEHINSQAKIVICGITPGKTQAEAALRIAKSGLKTKQDLSAIQLQAKQAASFKGLRKNLGQMLDKIGLHQKLNIESCDDLFGKHNSLVHYTSAVRYPTTLGGKDYSGTPKASRHPFLKLMLDTYLSEEIETLGKHCLWVPLGKGATDALEYMLKQGKLSKEQLITGLPHPSGANAESVALMLEESYPSLDNYQEDMYQKYLSTTQSKQPQNEEKYKSARRSRWENIAKVRRFYGID
ncbi:Uracil DNA glycosylase superfamily protein [Vibrio crassostreae]|nr:Uracil DNA glycosylase superfamily protein [Vibrio crassostreae]CAK2568100.1 Uracil DNA glycosylase superfamily protein [Vibrio crassostreae]CAK2585328.1 Uracil DNA glycosylase superfamily protein [Vibrio crassostreae]CAK2585377.1 Uracil DNA glycosylase superfamily protein [Vibrio crassostreae]CAK2589603.1 Uracil DNA glycosylase superfamily protein [Vibrio crassostreae]